MSLGWPVVLSIDLCHITIQLEWRPQLRYWSRAGQGFSEQNC